MEAAPQAVLLRAPGLQQCQRALWLQQRDEQGQRALGPQQRRQALGPQQSQ